jgi:hypothetical protein
MTNCRRKLSPSVLLLKNPSISLSRLGLKLVFFLPQNVLPLTQIFPFVALQWPTMVAVKFGSVADFYFGIRLYGGPELLIGHGPQMRGYDLFAFEAVGLE